MTVKKLFTRFVLASALSTPLVAQAADVPTGVQLADRQVLIKGNGTEPATLDPQRMEGLPGANIAKDLFEGLVTQDDHGNIVPGVASSWEESKDGLVHTFHLRKEAKWSNGDPVTADDFVFGFQRAVDPKTASPYAWYLQIPGIVNVDAIVDGKKPATALGVKAVDKHTFQVTLEKPVAFFVKMMAHQTASPAHRSVIEKWGDKWTSPEHIVSNGAYKMDRWIVNEKMVLKRNTKYWNNNKTVIDQVTYLPIQSETAVLNRYMAGEIDITMTIHLDHFKRLKKEIPNQIKITPEVATYYYVFNTRRKPFNDVRVRKALSYAINREAIASHVLGQGQKPAYAFTPEATNGFVKPDLAWEKMSQKERVAKAKKLLKEAGYSHSHPLHVKLLYNTSESHKKVAIVISQMWKQVLGVEVELVNEEWKTFLDTKRRGNFDIARAGWTGDYNEPSTMLAIWLTGGGNNDAKWSDKTYDDLIAKAMTTQNEAARGKLYSAAEKILAADMPEMPIYQYVQSRLVKPYVGGYPMHNAENTIYTKNLYIIKH